MRAPGRVDQVEQREAQPARRLLDAEDLLDRARAPRPGLHRRVVGHDGDRPPVHPPDAGDHAVGGQIARPWRWRTGRPRRSPCRRRRTAARCARGRTACRRRRCSAWYLGAPPLLGSSSASALNSSLRDMCRFLSSPERAAAASRRTPPALRCGPRWPAPPRRRARSSASALGQRAAEAVVDGALGLGDRQRAAAGRSPRASAAAASASSAAGTTSDTMPSASARAASTRRPVRISSLATATPGQARPAAACRPRRG